MTNVTEESIERQVDAAMATGNFFEVKLPAGACHIVMVKEVVRLQREARRLDIVLRQFGLWSLSSFLVLHEGRWLWPIIHGEDLYSEVRFDHELFAGLIAAIETHAAMVEAKFKGQLPADAEVGDENASADLAKFPRLKPTKVLTQIAEICCPPGAESILVPRQGGGSLPFRIPPRENLLPAVAADRRIDPKKEFVIRLAGDVGIVMTECGDYIQSVDEDRGKLQAGDRLHFEVERGKGIWVLIAASPASPANPQLRLLREADGLGPERETA